MNFPDRCKIKKALNNRLKNDGVWPQYNAVRAHLKQLGVDEGLAWRAAAFVFPPPNGEPAEIMVDPAYSEIVAKWESGEYTMPNAGDSPEKSSDDPKAIVAAPDQWRTEFQKLAARVSGRSASELEETRWVVANYLVDVKTIDAETVPSAAALSILMWCQMSPSNFGDFLRTNHAKLLPDKKALEFENRFRDTGQDLNLLIEFEESLRREQEAAEAADKGVASCQS